MLDGANDSSDSWRAALGRAVGRLGEPVIRTAVSQAMKILGRQFVFGRTIDEALKRAAPERAEGLSHSFDMLGEAAKTFADAERYAKAYADALDRIAAKRERRFRASRRASRSSSRRSTRATNGATPRRPRRRCCRCSASWR